jgi:acyl carrier protein
LQEVVASSLKVPVASVSDDSSPDTLRRWDSLRHLDLMTAVEEAFGVRFSTAEVLRAKSVGDIRGLLREKGLEAG